MILPGMTPSTSEAPIVIAAANGGHVAELAGGGQVTEAIFTERIAEVTAGLAPGQEVVVNALFLDPYLWNLQVGRERLVQRARAAGAPINGLTISAGIPDKPEALALLDELAAAGIWLNAFKPGTVAQVQEVLAIAADTPHTVWLHLEGGTAGGHHSWEDLDELLLGTYHLIREHENVVLAVGGGIADPERAGALLSGTWAHAHGAATMPVDAILLGTVTMATRESAASPSVKAALVAAAGHDGWVARGAVAGGTTSGRSGLNADIHFLDNSAARAARLLDEVAGDEAAVAARREEIVAALAVTAKPYFGDVAEMTYAEMLERFVVLTALGRNGRYEDGAWLDVTHRSRFIALLQQAEARLNPADSGRIATLFADPVSVDDPAAALALLVDTYPTARTALMHPADVAHFLSVARRPGKPVPFVPVIDADVRRWYQSDSLWQSHSDLLRRRSGPDHPGPGGRVRDHHRRRAGRAPARPVRDRGRAGAGGRRPRGHRRARHQRLPPGPEPGRPGVGTRGPARGRAGGTDVDLDGGQPHQPAAPDRIARRVVDPGPGGHVVLGWQRDGHPHRPARSVLGPHAGLARPRAARRR